jgi:hypothetical protein
MKNLILSPYSPQVILENHPNLESLTRYLYTLSISELKDVLYRFAKEEFYEHCLIVDKVIQEKNKYIVIP